MGLPTSCGRIPFRYDPSRLTLHLGATALVDKNAIYVEQLGRL